MHDNKALASDVVASVSLGRGIVTACRSLPADWCQSVFLSKVRSPIGVR